MRALQRMIVLEDRRAVRRGEVEIAVLDEPDLGPFAVDAQMLADAPQELDAEPADLDVHRRRELLPDRARGQRGRCASVARIALDDGHRTAERRVAQREAGDGAADHAAADDDDVLAHVSASIAKPGVRDSIRMTATLRYFTAGEVHAALDYGSLVEALREEFAAGATAPVRASHTVTAEGDRLLLMPAWDGVGLGVKIVTVFPRNRERGLASVAALYVLMDGTTGHPIALIDGEALTLRRTSATSALASSYLSRADARHLVVVGTGALAPYMAAAHCATRPIERISVWGRSRAAAERTAAALATQGLPAEAVADLAERIGRCGYRLLRDDGTRADRAKRVRTRRHARRPGRRVHAADARKRRRSRCARRALRRHVRRRVEGSGRPRAADARGVITRDRVRAELADLVSGRHPGRRARDEVTLFKSVGTALEDLCAAKLVAAKFAAIKR